MPKEELKIIQIGTWEAGHHESTGKIVVVSRYTDREPLAFGCDPHTAEQIAKAMLALVAESRQRKH